MYAMVVFIARALCVVMSVLFGAPKSKAGEREDVATFRFATFRIPLRKTDGTMAQVVWGDLDFNAAGHLIAKRRLQAGLLVPFTGKLVETCGAKTETCEHATILGGVETENKEKQAKVSVIIQAASRDGQTCGSAGSSSLQSFDKLSAYEFGNCAVGAAYHQDAVQNANACLVRLSLNLQQGCPKYPSFVRGTDLFLLIFSALEPGEVISYKPHVVVTEGRFSSPVLTRWLEIYKQDKPFAIGNDVEIEHDEN
jgi:hypothetical protein